MTSSLEKPAEHRDHAVDLPDNNWADRRLDTIKSHEPSIAAVLETIDKMGYVLLEGRISTNLRTHSTGDMQSTHPNDNLASTYFNIIPAIPGCDTVQTGESHDGWQPETAMNIQLSLDDQYDYSDDSAPRPTGNVQLTMRIRTWGNLSDTDRKDIEAVPGTETTYGDSGYSRLRTQVTTVRSPGETLAADEVEAILAPLSSHITRYYDIMNTDTKIRKSERAGDFSNGARVLRRPAPEQQWHGQTATSFTPTRQVASRALRSFQRYEE